MKSKKIILLISLIIMIFGIGITYSIFRSSTNVTTSDQNLAKFVFETEDLNNLELSLINLIPGSNQDYLFSVKNNAEGDISEVSLEYKITIKTYHLVPFIIKLYKLNANEEEFIAECDETYNRNEQNELVCNVPNQIMPYNNANIDNYKLTVEFPEEYNDHLYADLVDYINLDIKSWQITN